MPAAGLDTAGGNIHKSMNSPCIVQRSTLDLLPLSRSANKGASWPAHSSCYTDQLCQADDSGCYKPDKGHDKQSEQEVHSLHHALIHTGVLQDAVN